MSHARNALPRRHSSKISGPILSILVELIMEMEETFDVQIADNELEKIRTIKDVLDFIKSKGTVWNE